MNLLKSPFSSRDNKIKEEILSGEDVVSTSGIRTWSLIRKTIVFLVGIAFVILIWYLVAWYYNTYMIYALKFPDPVSAFERVYGLWVGDFSISGVEFSDHILASLKRWVMGFSLAFLIGLTIGISMGINEKIYEFGSVPVTILQMIPGLAWFPVTILLFGFGEESAIFIIAITVISPIAISIANGIRQVPPVYRRLSSMSGMSYTNNLIGILIPFAALDIVTGLRIGMANGWRMLISAEMVVGVIIGLGYSIDAAVALSNYTTAFACIVVICIIGLVIDKLILSPIENYVGSKTGLGAK